jgi:hypothetical protein
MERLFSLVCSTHSMLHGPEFGWHVVHGVRSVEEVAGAAGEGREAGAHGITGGGMNCKISLILSWLF